MNYHNIWLLVKQKLIDHRFIKRCFQGLALFCFVIFCMYVINAMNGRLEGTNEVFTTKALEEKNKDNLPVKNSEEQGTKYTAKQTKKQGQTTPKEPNMKTTQKKKEVVEQPVNKININAASKEELMEIPYIGAKKADDILSYREQFGFSAIEDLMEVKGIGEKTFEKILDFITV